MNEQENEALEQEGQDPEQGEAFLDGFDGEDPQTGTEQAQAEEPAREPLQDDGEEADRGEPVPDEADRLPQEQSREDIPAPSRVEGTVDQTVREQVDRGIAEFAKAFPEAYGRAKADPGTIPEAVWADVRAGMSLTAAYARYAVAQTARVRQSQMNAQRSTGSMRSAGSDSKGKDAFLAGFDE